MRPTDRTGNVTGTEATRLIQTFPHERVLPKTPDEVSLRELYPHPPGMVRLGMICGPHGEAVGKDESSRSLQGPEDRRIIRVLRAAADVVVVGRATALREGYGPIRVRDALAATRSADQASAPLVAVVTVTGSVPDGLDPNNALLVTTRQAPAATLASEWGESLVLAGDMVLSPRDMIDAFANRGLTRVLCEGGPALAGMLLDATIITDYCLTTSPHKGAKSSLRVPVVPESMKLVHALEGDGFVYRRWTYNPVDVTSG